MIDSGLKWLYDTCQVCGKQYSYIEAYRPSTCTRKECVESDLGQKLLKESEDRLREKYEQNKK